MIQSLLVFLDAVASEVAVDAVATTGIVEKLSGMTPDEIMHAITALTISLAGLTTPRDICTKRTSRPCPLTQASMTL